MMGVARDGGGGTSCARRPRERRLRSFLHHEQMAVALHLSEALHHSSGASVEPLAERREEEVEAEVVYDAPRGTGAASTGDAAGQSFRPRAAAAGGSHGRLRGCLGVPPHSSRLGAGRGP